MSDWLHETAALLVEAMELVQRCGGLLADTDRATAAECEELTGKYEKLIKAADT